MRLRDRGRIGMNVLWLIIKEGVGLAGAIVEQVDVRAEPEEICWRGARYQKSHIPTLLDYELSLTTTVP